MKRLPLLFTLIALLPLCASADTAITKVPFIIDKPGLYYFTKNLGYTAASLDAIKVEATDVVIDLGGFELVGVAPNNVANGIEFAAENRVTIRDGTIRGFQVGVYGVDSDYVSVSNLLVTNCLEAGVSITGNHAQISQNHISDTGNSASTTATYSVGISLTGTYGTISDNELDHTFVTDANGHSGAGIRLQGCSNVVVSNNHVLDVEPSAPAKGGVSAGIQANPASPSSTLVFLGNIVLTAQNGLDLSGATGASYGDNITGGVASGYLTTGSNNSDVGGNH